MHSPAPYPSTITFTHPDSNGTLILILTKYSSLKYCSHAMIDLQCPHKKSVSPPAQLYQEQKSSSLLFVIKNIVQQPKENISDCDRSPDKGEYYEQTRECWDLSFDTWNQTHNHIHTRGSLWGDKGSLTQWFNRKAFSFGLFLPFSTAADYNLPLIKI